MQVLSPGAAVAEFPRPVATLASTERAECEARFETQLDDLESLGAALTADAPPLDYAWPAEFTLSIVIPVFNEERTIRTVLARVLALPMPKEVIVVDDCSTDGTADELAELARSHALRVIRQSPNAGKGAALRTGFAAATGDVVIVQDADLEYDPRDIPSVVQPIVAGDADVVFGSRFLGEVVQDRSWLHRFGNRLLTLASNLFTGLRLTDMETCYKAFRRPVLQSLTVQQNRFGFEPEITAKVARRGYRVREVPITYRARSFAEGKKIRLKDAFNALYCIVRYWRAD